MDPQIQALLLDFKQATGDENRLTPEEKRRFDSVTRERVWNYLHDLLPSESPIFERIDPKTGTVVYNDSYGRHGLPLMNLGYELIKDGDEFVFKPKLSQREYVK